MVAGFDAAMVNKTSSSFTANNEQSSSLLPATDCEQTHQKLADTFKELQDPRGKQGVLHPFLSIVMIALLATIGGATGWEYIETYGVVIIVGYPAFWNYPLGYQLLILIADFLSAYPQLNLSAALIAG